MASGRNHDRASVRWSIPFGLCINLIIGFPYGLIAGLLFCLGGLWLSPDLDTYSLALKRWGILQVIWWPYRKIIPHRSIFSHGPLIGTSIRILYLIIWIIFFILLFKRLSVPTSIKTIQHLFDQIQRYPKLIITSLLGLEASSWLHLIKDGDPMPAEWHKWRKK